ncbi:LANO_0H23728g1_1 [Lachancea nothofagi CBS 11611]|uniref:LANO_0H23728g1_1 n=1 Tax=Lachancea nothofagi CBS 11611 TaxID=1266666 RepID=A0A1G4KNX7_9SACH|nr:LANO_0H23728g1_1 [Lachancea nothofagi CBS 11611]
MVSRNLTSLDDCVLIKQNMMLLENITDLQRPAVDYYHFDFSSEHPLAMPQSWNLLLHMGKYKLLRLPSCSAEDEFDYQMYVKRLHHCLWRRWSISYFKLGAKKMDPGAINWNKEQDFTVLYGPDLSLGEDCDKEIGTWGLLSKHTAKSDVRGGDLDSDVEELATCFSSSLESRDSSIFDHVPHKPCLRQNSDDRRGRGHALHFDDEVLRRDIDSYGSLYEHKIHINDTEAHLQDCESDLESEPEHVQYSHYSPDTWDSDSDLDLEFT